MPQPLTWRARRINFMHRWHARRAGRADVSTAFLNTPEPRSIGLISKGQQLLAGQFLFSGHAVQDPRISLWDMPGQNTGVAAEIHGGAWLDDLAAVGDERAQRKAQSWVLQWIARYGRGTGPGWTPGLTGHRLTRWINHGAFLTGWREPAQETQFFQSRAQQTLF